MRRIGLFLLLLYPLISSAEDTASLKDRFNFGAEFWGAHLWQGTENHFHLPPFIRENRRDAHNAFRTYDTYNDNPLRHGAYYAALKTSISLSRDIKLDIDLYAEHRGVSYGPFRTDNIILYPVLQAETKDSIRILNRIFRLEGEAGHFLNEKLDEGLMIYNTDVQGIKASISTGKWTISYAIYGDLNQSMPLNIDDMDSYSLTRRIGRKNAASAGIALTIAPQSFQSYKNNLYYNAFFGYKMKRGRVYTQVGYRNDLKILGYKTGFPRQLGAVAGINHKYKLNKFSARTTGELRYYGSSFNFYHYSNRLRYRDPNKSMYANTIGEHLYPLRKFDTPFSQWSVFTEYVAYNTASATLAGNLSYTIKRIEAALDYDLNYIHADPDPAYPGSLFLQRSRFLYSFFTAGFYYKPLENFKTGLVFTNKGMNLDAAYPTLYQFTRPYLGIRLHASI